MTPYDAAMAGVIVAGMVWGAFRGITWQVASLLSLVLGYSVAHPVSGQLAPHLPGEPLMARALAMIVVYFGVSGGVFMTAWIIRATLKRLKFEAFDRHLGMLLGGAEGALLGLVGTLFVVSLAPQTRNPIFESPTGRVVGQLMAVLGPVLPEEARGVLAPFWANSSTSATSTPTARADEAPPAPISAEVREPSTTADARRAPRGVRVDRTTDPDTKPATLSEFVRQSERRIGRAVIDGAAEGLRRAANGGGGDGRGGAIERR